MMCCSRDTILHIDDKEELFRKFLYTLKPGGKLMISDYCHGDKVVAPNSNKNHLTFFRSTANSSKTMLPNEVTSLKRSRATAMS